MGDIMQSKTVRLNIVCCIPDHERLALNVNIGCKKWQQAVP